MEQASCSTRVHRLTGTGGTTPKICRRCFPTRNLFQGFGECVRSRAPNFQGSDGFDTLFIEVFNKGAIQFATTSDQPDNPDCRPDETTACLHNRRFKVPLMVQDDPSGSPRPARVRSSDDGSTVFTDAEINVDFLYTLGDGCSTSNPAFSSLLFATPDTSVEFNMTVTDTKSGQQKVYENPLGTQFEPVTDRPSPPVPKCF